MAVAPEAVIVPSDGHEAAQLYSFDPQRGTLHWKTPFSGGVGTDPVRLDDRSLVVVTPTGSISAIDAARGRILWTSTCHPVPGVPRGLGLSSDGMLYVGTLKGKVLAYPLE
jgi:outer membrane protein assembly factor BamB